MEVQGYRFNLQEFAGGWRDVGVLIPLVVALITLSGLNPSAVFLTVLLLSIPCFRGLIAEPGGSRKSRSEEVARG